MSFSTLLMPLGLYTPFVDGIGHFDMSVLIPGGIGALITVILLAKAVNALFDRFYSLAFHAIIGIVIAATVMIIPYASFAVSVGQCLVNLACLAVGHRRRPAAGPLQHERQSQGNGIMLRIRQNGGPGISRPPFLLLPQAEKAERHSFSAIPFRNHMVMSLRLLRRRRGFPHPVSPHSS